MLEKGEKKQLLFLHGYLSSGSSFILQTSYFSKFFNVYAPDLTGFGNAKKMEYPYSLDDYAREVKEYVINNKLNKPHVIAHSFGGRIAIKLASLEPELFDKIVLTDSAGLKPRWSFKKCVKRLTFKALKKFINKQKLIRFYSADYQKLDDVMRQSFKLIVNQHLDGEIGKIKNQTLIVNGEADKDTPLYMAKRLNKGIPQSKLLILKGAGHFSFLDKPMRYNMEVGEFLLS